VGGFYDANGEYIPTDENGGYYDANGYYVQVVQGGYYDANGQFIRTDQSLGGGGNYNNNSGGNINSSNAQYDQQGGDENYSDANYDGGGQGEAYGFYDENGQFIQLDQNGGYYDVNGQYIRVQFDNGMRRDCVYFSFTDLLIFAIICFLFDCPEFSFFSHLLDQQQYYDQGENDDECMRRY
jgi:hypothetical protein